MRAPWLSGGSESGYVDGSLDHWIDGGSLIDLLVLSISLYWLFQAGALDLGGFVPSFGCFGSTSVDSLLCGGKCRRQRGGEKVDQR